LFAGGSFKAVFKRFTLLEYKQSFKCPNKVSTLHTKQNLCIPKKIKDFKNHVHLHKGIGFPPKLEITNYLNRIRRIHFINLKKSQFLLIIIARMSSLSKVVEDEV
jgi:hypothetical protein